MRQDLYFVSWDLCLNFKCIFQFCVCSRAENCWVLFSGTHFCAGCFYVFSLSKQFPMFSVRLVYRSIILFLPTRVLRSTKHYSQSFSNRLFRATGFFFVLLAMSLSSGWLPLGTRTSSRSSPAALCCFATDFLCLPIDVLLIDAVVPGPLQRLCIVLLPGFLCIR